MTPTALFCRTLIEAPRVLPEDLAAELREAVLISFGAARRRNIQEDLLLRAAASLSLDPWKAAELLHTLLRVRARTPAVIDALETRGELVTAALIVTKGRIPDVSTIYRLLKHHCTSGQKCQYRLEPRAEVCQS